jgi:membrane protease YdiL (CAAX protease family)
MEHREPRPVRQGPLRLLPQFLFDTRQPTALYVLKAWLLVFLPSASLAVAVSLTAAHPPSPDFGGTGPVVFAMLVLFAPVVETFLMVPAVLLLDRFFGPAVAAIGSAVLWGALHSAAEPLWGLIVWWPFLIFSTILLVWKERGLAAAMLVVIAVHAMQNGLAGLGLLFG